MQYSEQRLCFQGVYIKRSTIDLVGLLDERFTGYGSDDDDYCLRVRKAGLFLAVTSEVVMQHGFGRLNATASFARTMGDVKSSGQEMYRRFQEKCQTTE
jgi:GT2 family glycosyltransferase